MQRLSGVCIDAGVDWITATYKRENGLDEPRDIALGLAEVEQSAGEIGRPLSWKGYEGFQCGHLLYGERMDGCVVQLSGFRAGSHWMRLYRCASNVSRIDLQGTFRIDGPVGPSITNHFREMKKHASMFKRAPQPALFIGRDDSRTVYSGSPASDRKGRIYDKGAESGMDHFQNSVRYEVVLTSKRAMGAAHQLSSRCSDLPAIARTALAFFEHRGAYVEPLTTSLTDCVSIETSAVRARPSDCERSLTWLTNSVSPSVKRLVDRGYLQQVLEALNLDHLVQPAGSSFGSLLLDKERSQPNGSLSRDN